MRVYLLPMAMSLFIFAMTAIYFQTRQFGYVVLGWLVIQLVASWDRRRKLSHASETDRFSN